MSLSIVVPVLNEEANVAALHARVRAAMAEVGEDFELIFVDDGSTDASLREIAALAASDPRVKALSFSRNFGHQAALTAGLDHARGDAVVMLDADLQHPPELIPQMVRLWRAGNPVVYSIRSPSADTGPLKRASSWLFYALFRRLAGLDIPWSAADFRLLDRRVVRALGSIRERARFLRGLIAWTGFRSVGVPYEAAPRAAGRSKYSFARMVGLAIDALVSFSPAPLYLALYGAAGVWLLGLVYAVYALVVRFVLGTAVPGWTSVILLVLLLAGIQLLVLGFIGLYLGKLYEEAKERPIYLVAASVGLEPRPPAS